MVTLPAARAAEATDRRLFGVHAMFDAAGELDGYGIGAVPPRSPYRPGDWVVMHGYPGCPEGPRRTGVRGFVLGCRGSTLLFGLTDDGREWCEHWGALRRDGTPGDSAVACTCCAHPERYAARAEQLDFLDLLDVA